MRRLTGITLGHVSLALVGLMFAMPFLFPSHRYPIPSFYNEWLAFALGLCALVVLVRPAAWKSLPLPALALVPVAFLVLVALQAAFGMLPYVEQATVAAQYLAWSAALVVLGAVLRGEFGAARVVTIMAEFVVVGALLNCLAALLQHYGLSDLIGTWITPKMGPAVYGNLAQRNHFACYLTLGLISLAYLVARGCVRPAVAAAPGGLFLLMLALASSRSTFLYIVMLLGLAAVLHLRLRDPASRRIVAFMAFALPGFVVANWIAGLEALAPFFGESITAGLRVFDTVGGIDQRLQVWREAWWMFLQAPWFGLGYGQFAWHHHFYHGIFDIAVTRGESFNHAHNLALHVLAELGLAGAAILAVGAIVAVMDIKRLTLDSEWFWLAGVAAVLALFSMLEFPLWYSYFLGVGAFALGVVGGRRIEMALGRVGPAVAILVLGAGSVVLTSTAVNYRDFEELFFIRGLERPEHADRERFFGIMERLYEEPLLVPYVELAAAYVSPVDVPNLGRQRALFDRAFHFAPRWVVYRRSLLIALTGDLDSARRELLVAYKVYPHDLPAFVDELQELSRAHPAALGPLLELANEKFLDYAAAQAVK